MNQRAKAAGVPSQREQMRAEDKVCPGIPKTYRFKGSTLYLRGHNTYYFVGFGATGVVWTGLGFGHVV